MKRACKIFGYSLAIWLLCFIITWMVSILVTGTTDALQWDEASIIMRMFVISMLTIVPLSLIDLALDSDNAINLKREG